LSARIKNKKGITAMQKKNLQFSQVSENQWDVIWKDISIGNLKKEAERHFVFERRLIDGMPIEHHLYGMDKPEECITAKRNALKIHHFHHDHPFVKN
jgi:hypothetical protein